MNFSKQLGRNGRCPKPSVFPALFLLLLVTLSACGGSGNGGENTAARRGKLACAGECALYGQCGQNQADNTVILGNTGQPETRNHNMTLPQDTAVIILGEQPELLYFPPSELGPEREEMHNFYQIQTEDGAATGWVAAWCVAATE